MPVWSSGQTDGMGSVFGQAPPRRDPRRSRRIASSALQLGWAAALVTRPTQVAATVAGRPTPPAWIVRVLGARQLLQQVVVLAVPTPAVARAAAGVEAVHALSMLAATALAPRYRRAELVSAGVAVAAAVLTRAGADVRSSRAGAAAA